MTQWLVKTFIKDHENVKNSRVRTAYGLLGSIVAMICNLLLFSVKFCLSVALHSVSVGADAFNNLSDCISNIISFAGVKMADKPADKAHPFGHGRMEYIAALMVAFLVIEVGVTFLKESVSKILTPQTMIFQWLAVAVLLFSMAVKCWMAYFNRRIGRQIGSKVMEATARDALGDVLATVVTLFSLLFYEIFQINIDGYAGLLVSLFIIWAGIGIVKDTSEPLLGAAVDPAVYHEITEFVENHEGICGTHDLIVHSYGPAHSMASIHAEVSSSQNIVKCHELIDRIEREANKELGIFLVIHMDPVELDSRELNAAREKVVTILNSLDERLSIHDFRLIKENGTIRLIFDMTVPYEFDEKQQEDIKKRLESILRIEEPNCRCEITYDKSFIGGEDITNRGVSV